MSLGQKLKYKRNILGLSQYELSEKTGISQPYLSQIETGQFKPTAPMLVSLAVALKCSTDYLLFDERNEKQ